MGRRRRIPPLGAYVFFDVPGYRIIVCTVLVFYEEYLVFGPLFLVRVLGTRVAVRWMLVDAATSEVDVKPGDGRLSAKLNGRVPVFRCKYMLYA